MNMLQRNSADRPEFMRALLQVNADDASIVYPVFHNPACRIRCVYDGLLIQEDTNMDNTAFCIIKKSHISGY